MIFQAPWRRSCRHSAKPTGDCGGYGGAGESPVAVAADLVKAKGEGDSTFSVFDSPASAVAAALELQRTVAAEPWSLPVPLAVRVAVHAGDVQEREADFYGPVVNRCARLRAIGHGGQTLLSAAAAELVWDATRRSPAPRSWDAPTEGSDETGTGLPAFPS
jgi:class 3 adenylate cyclase